MPTEPSGGAPADAVLTEWPSGKTGWTVQLATFDDKSKAETEAKKAAAQSISAGVLEGKEYEKLGADQWVVFMGQYDSRAAARMAAKGYAAKGFSGDVRQIKPKK
jgi:septal ring-binding cell division protein DamX